MSTTHTSFCRVCLNACPTLVEVEDGRLLRVTGDPDNELFAGYTCTKGRVQPDVHAHPERLLRPHKRLSDGSWVEISSMQALDEIAARLTAITDLHGPAAVASYFGNAVFSSCLTEPFISAFMAALGSHMSFNPNTIDKPGKAVARALHGSWQAPAHGYHSPEVALILGANPAKSHYGLPGGSPGVWLREQQRTGMTLVVVDPRETELARKADLHLQPRPGHDAAILACLIRVILAGDLQDAAFVVENARGLDELAAAVQPFDPVTVGLLAGVEPHDLVRAAELFATPERGYAVAGVGPGFSGSSTLIEYLLLDLETLCGHWMGEGEKVLRTTSLLPPTVARAQAGSPASNGELPRHLRDFRVARTPAGYPTGLLPEEMLTDDESRVRALLSVAGNPVSAWPDQNRVVEALTSLDLLVQVDPWMSATARLADYVIAPRMAYEMAGATLATDIMIAAPIYYGPPVAHAQYTPAVTEPPVGADVIADWEVLYGLGQRMDLQLRIGRGSLAPAGSSDGVFVDMTETPEEEDLIAQLLDGGRVSLAQVRSRPHGSTYVDPDAVVQPREPGWPGRFELANAQMMKDLALALAPRAEDRNRPFRLIHRREADTMNSMLTDTGTRRGRVGNPAYLHPDDLAELGVEEGEVVVVASERAAVRAIAAADERLRRGLVSMTHGFGGSIRDPSARDDDAAQHGTATGRLLDIRQIADPFVGMPRMNDVAVSVVRGGPSQ